MAHIKADILGKKMSHQGLFYSNCRGRHRRKRWPEPIFATWTGRLWRNLSRAIEMIEQWLRYVWKVHFMAILLVTHTLGLPQVLPPIERVEAVAQEILHWFSPPFIKSCPQYSSQP